MAARTYAWLMSRGGGDPLDRHLLACSVALAATDPSRPLADCLGLSPTQLSALLRSYFPHALGLAAGDGSPPVAIEEDDLRRLLLDHRTAGRPEEEWLAAIVARRCQEANHLWQDLGLTGRADLGALMRRHFAPLAARNDRDMKWKKFFYRQLCGQEGVPICKSPVCDACDDFGLCFGAEDGISLLARSAREDAAAIR